MATINIAKDFSNAPGARHRDRGKNSGQEFREDFLEKFFTDGSSEIVVLELDGTYGYPVSFLEEVFGGLARIYGSEAVLKRLQFISDEEPLLINEIISYISDAE